MPEVPGYLQELIDRFDPEPFDAPSDRARVRLRVRNDAEYDVTIRGEEARLKPANLDAHPDATLTANEKTWKQIAADIRGGMTAYGRGQLEIRQNLHLGVGLLAATSGMTDPGRLEFHRAKTKKGPTISYLAAGTGPQTVVCIHGLGGTKGSFLPTVAALADDYRVIAFDLPGFGDSDKPIAAAYDAAYFARTTAAFMDELEIDRAHIIGNSMGGRVALELGFDYPDRTDRIALLAPSLAWLRERKWASALRFVRPELGLLQVAPRPIVEAVVQKVIPGARDGWTAIGVDEFMRAYLQPRGRAAFYAAARNIYLEEPHGEKGFWTRLGALEPETLFVWGKRDNVVPIRFARHVEQVLPRAKHVEIDCGHVPQVERSEDTHRAVRGFFAAREPAAATA